MLNVCRVDVFRLKRIPSRKRVALRNYSQFSLIIKDLLVRKIFAGKIALNEGV